MADTGVLISIKPQWIKKIMHGQKTIEVRKIKPRLSPPFTVYGYCTITGGDLWLAGIIGKREPVKLNGKVCFEFTCDRIDEIVIKHGMGMVFKRGDEYIRFDDFNDMRLTKQQLYDYLGGKTGYGWHISDLKTYEHPLDLDDINYEGSMDPVVKAPQSMVYVDNPHQRCVNCQHREDSHCTKLNAFLHYETIFQNSCAKWEQSTKGCYAINGGEADA